MPAQPLLGEIGFIGGVFAPKGSMACEGQLIPISQNQALYSLIGTSYGGNGVTNFALPDLRGASPIGAYQASTRTLPPNRNQYGLGQQGGMEQIHLNSSHLPSHNHTFSVSSGTSNSNIPDNRKLSQTASRYDTYAYTESVNANKTLNNNAVGYSGGGSPLPLLSPYLCVNIVIWSTGDYPQRP